MVSAPFPLFRFSCLVAERAIIYRTARDQQNVPRLLKSAQACLLLRWLEAGQAVGYTLLMLH